MNAMTIDRDELLQRAREATANSVAPYSGIRVAAALRTGSGEIVTGVNVESASYGLTCCAERVALFNALSHGYREFSAMALVSSVEPGLLPCGACRQLLSEYAAEAVIWCGNLAQPDSIREFAVRDLMPEPLIELPSNR